MNEHECLVREREWRVIRDENYQRMLAHHRAWDEVGPMRRRVALADVNASFHRRFATLAMNAVPAVFDPEELRRHVDMVRSYEEDLECLRAMLDEQKTKAENLGREVEMTRAVIMKMKADIRDARMDNACRARRALLEPPNKRMRTDSGEGGGDLYLGGCTPMACLCRCHRVYNN